MRSLRVLFLLGSLLWTCGLLAIAHLLAMALLHHLPFLMRTPRLLMVATALVLMTLGVWLVLRGLGPIALLRQKLAAVRTGQARQIDGVFPGEVQPLVDDLNQLLAHREATVQRAIARSGDLAHGLKTPLALLMQEAETLAASGQTELATAVGAQVEKMRRQIDYHLAQARAAAAGALPGTRSHLLASAEGLARTLRRLYAGRELEMEIQVDAGLAVKAQREDLEEMLGNLLDNACKWAKTRIRLEARVDPASGRIVILVEDDGPGLSPEQRQLVLERGVRADEAAPGSGLGLAIVRDLAGLYGGEIQLGASTLGGLSARLELPPAGDVSR